MGSRRPLNRLFEIAAVCLISSVFLGWSGDLEKFSEKAKTVRSLSADFVQEKHLRILVQPLVSKGLFYFNKPGSLRWEYREPVGSILLMHNGEIRQFLKGKNGYREDNGPGIQGMQVVMGEISLWLSGNFRDNPDFEATVLDERMIVLIPKAPSLSKFISKIELLPSDRPGVIQSVAIYEGDDSFTIIRFENVRVNEDLQESLFTKK